MQATAPGMHHQPPPPSPCKHCAKLHPIKQQLEAEPSSTLLLPSTPPLSPKECGGTLDPSSTFTLLSAFKSTFVPFATARKKLAKSTESSVVVNSRNHIDVMAMNNYGNLPSPRLKAATTTTKTTTVCNQRLINHSDSINCQKPTTNCHNLPQFPRMNSFGIDGATVAEHNVSAAESLILRSSDEAYSLISHTYSHRTGHNTESIDSDGTTPAIVQRFAQSIDDNASPPLPQSNSKMADSSNSSNCSFSEIKMTSTIAAAQSNRKSSGSLKQSTNFNATFESSSNSPCENHQIDHPHLCHRNRPRRSRCKNSCICCDEFVISGNSKQTTPNGFIDKQRAATAANRWPYAITSTIKYSNVLLICIAFIVFGVRSALVLADDSPANSQLNVTENGICTSKDVRNWVSSFKELKGCRIIEGFLMITLIDKYNEADYEGLEFPELTEVTDFVLFYRVNGLKSLGKLFPNLRVIRGNQLIKDFSLVVFEMMHLQEIGLKSLTHILRGSVRIEKNPALCFADTIDWAQITSNSGNKENIISLNKPTNECPICPSGKKSEAGGEMSKEITDSINCPESPTTKQRLCWNRHQCQLVCPAVCGNMTCNSEGQCCDESCIGCEKNDTNVCTTCRHLSFGGYPNRKCVERCPPNTFEHENRRCITAEECRRIKRPVFVKVEFNLHEYPYIPIEGKCKYECPSNFYPDGESGQRKCVKCGPEGCKKECPPGSIDSISTAQRYLGCTHITGPLVINIRNQGGYNIVHELETFLSDIEVIEGPLHIIRSFPLLSLSFFKKLSVIKGDPFGKDRYGLKVIENQNLQALFERNVTIEKGRLFFHFNPKLCMNIIEAFKENVLELRNVSKLPVDEVAPNSNGDKIACNVTALEVEVKKTKHNMVLLELKPLAYDDERQLLGYLLYYMPAPTQNITMFDGRDACGGDGWQVDDVVDNNRNSTPISVLVTHLKPFTQYAYYIRTYTVASETRGGITPIKYFRTMPWKPDVVTRLSVKTNGSSEIIVEWKPPVNAHGNLTTYIIKCTMVKDDAQLLEQRNYCKEPLGPEKIPVPPIPSDTIKPTPKDKDKASGDGEGCPCDGEDGRERSKFKDLEAEQLIEFEDELHNTVYVRAEPVRRRRDLSSQIFENTTANFNIIKARTRGRRSDNTSILSVPEKESSNYDVFPTHQTNPDTLKPPAEDKISRKEEGKDYYIYVYEEVNASITSLTLKELKHFSYYSVSVKACRDGPGDNCSNEVIAHERTAKIETADDITDVSVDKVPTSNYSTGGVRLRWSAPVNPNGLIHSYTIRYQSQIEHAKFQDICVPQTLYRNQSGSHIIPNLINGNYSFMVMANSLAGPNNRWSKPVVFNVNEPTITVGLIVLIFSMILVLISILVGVFWFYRRKYGPPDSGLKLIASVNPEYVSMQYTPDEWEIPREKIIQLNELGQGSFGMVYEGIVLNLDRDRERIRCAIKTVNENATDRERINFLKEAAVMKAFDTHHVVRLLGVVSRGQPVLVIMELMVNGDLKGYLRSHRPESGNESAQPPTLRRILQMAIEIADGMAYLSAKKFVHRDLAARNCMVAEDLTVKIGDFGMTRDIYETDYYRKGTKGLLPVRWMAPESLKDGVFSSSSDVFSFGIVLWEMATLASQPYQGLSNDQVLRYVIDGGVMERPENCPERLYQLMCKCWQHRPSARPTFIQIVTMLLDEASSGFRNVSFYHSQAGQELLTLPQHQMLEVVDVRTPLRAEEENFSVGVDDDEPEDPNSFLMENRNISHSHSHASASGPSNSPLRNSTNSSSNIPDVALSKLIPKINYSQMPSTSAPTNQSEQFATDVSTSPFTIPYKNHGATSSQQQPSSVPLSSLLLLDSPKPNNNRCIAALSTPITQFNSLYGRNGIKSSLARGQLQRSSDNDSNSDNRSDAASSSRRNNSPSSIISYLQKSSSGSGDAKVKVELEKMDYYQAYMR